MKRIIIAIIALLSFVTVSSAQSVKDIYNKYSGQKGVSTVYISPTMFNLMKKLPEIEINDTNVQMASLIRSFDGMYILEIENNFKGARDLANSVKSMINKGKYELIMSAREENESINIYIKRADRFIKEFLLLSEEDHETAMICICGEIKEENLTQVLKGF